MNFKVLYVQLNLVPALSDDLHIKIKKRRRLQYGWVSEDASESKVQISAVLDKETSGRTITQRIVGVRNSRSAHTIKSTGSNNNE